MTIWVWLALSAVTAVGVAVQSLLGFGANLLLVPAALAVHPGAVPIATTALNLLLSAGVAVRDLRSADGPVVRRVLLGAAPGAAAGAWLSAIATSSALATVAAVAVIGAVVVRASGATVPNTRATGVGAGVLTGLMAVTTSITGPPVALLMAGSGPARGRATVAVTGTVASAAALVVLLALPGSPGRASISDVGLLLPAVVVGALLGRRALRSLAPRTVERLVLAVSLASALGVLVRVLVG